MLLLWASKNIFKDRYNGVGQIQICWIQTCLWTCANLKVKLSIAKMQPSGYSARL